MARALLSIIYMDSKISFPLFRSYLQSILLTVAFLFSASSSFADQNAAYQQCAIDLCGPASNYERILAQGNFGNASNETKSFVKDNLDPMLDEAFSVAMKYKKLSTAFADKNTNLALPMNDQQRAFLTTMTYMSSVSKVIGEVIKSSDGRTFQIDKERLKIKIPQLTQQQLDSHVTVLNALLATKDFQTGISFDRTDYDHVLEGWGDNTDRNLQWIKNSMAGFLGVLGSSIKQTMNFEVIDKAILDKKSLTAAEKKIFMDTLARFSRVRGMISSEIIAITNPLNMQLSDAANILHWSDRSKKIQQTLASQKLIDSSQNEVRKQCHDAWVQSLATGPSELRQRQAEKLLNQVKALGKKVLPRYFSNEALEHASAAVDQMTFSKPQTLPQIQSQLIETFSFSLNENKKLETQLASATNLETVGYTILAIAPLFEDEFNIFDSIQTTCKRMGPQTFNDKAYGNSIVTSWQSTIFPEIGVGVIAHELGHIISASVEKEGAPSLLGFINARTCSVKKHALLAQDTDNIPKYNQYAEEDWADVFAADVILDIEKSWPYVTNYACSLIDLEDKEAKYKGLKIWDPQGNDTHSSGFLRALQLQTALKRPLPPSCIQAMTENERSVIGRSCSQ